MLFRARPSITKGDEARDRHEWTVAADHYRTALGRNPRLPAVWMQYGHTMVETGRPAEALAAYRKADALRPGTIDTNMHLGHMLKALGHDDEARTHYAAAYAIDPLYYPGLREATRLSPRTPYDQPDRLGYVMLGTTGLCNASCLHCPTGKAATAANPRIPMAMPLFHHIIDSLVEMNLPILGQLAFGLFGDGFVDPFVVQRVRYAREKLPFVPISVNSNGAAFDPAKHAVLKDMNILVGLHCESIVPETFNHLMAPLRHERVVAKYEMILETFGAQTSVSVPVSRPNLDEVTKTRAWFEARGAKSFSVPLMSRCATDLRLFNQIAIAPEPNRCSSAALDDLSIDCDGVVLACCQDFQRKDPIGDLRHQTLREVIYGAERQERMRAFDAGEHQRFVTCSNCLGDRREAIEAEMAAAEMVAA